MLLNLIYGYMNIQCLNAILEFNIPDHLTSGPKTIDELARASSSDVNALYRIMRCLAAQGIFIERQNKEFELNDASRLLVKENSGNLINFISICANEFYHASTNLTHTLKDGSPAFEKYFQMDFWKYLEKNTDRAEIFNTAMEKGFNNTIIDILTAYNFSHYKNIIDVGGGKGQLVCSILKNNPSAQGIIYDLPYVVDSAKMYISQNNLTDRCSVISGDFFKEIPANGDIYLLRVILHDWDDEKALLLLRNCRKVLNEKAKLVIIEKIIMENDFKIPTFLGDINMLVSLPGKERTLQEYSNLLSQSDFKINKIINTNTAFSIIEALPN